ncbi:hypothetical protein HN51_030198, partial [Arachis hypogaea]
LLLGGRVVSSASRQNLYTCCMEQKENNEGMLMGSPSSSARGNKGAFLVVAKGHVPPSGPSHRGHATPHVARHVNNTIP